MTCDTLTCQLTRIADDLTAFDLNDFLSTLLATLFGALIAAVVSVALYRHEQRRKRRSEIDAAVVVLIRAVQGYSRDYTRFTQVVGDRVKQSPQAVQQGWDTRIQSVPEPDRTEIDTAIESLIVITDGSDRGVAERTREVLYELTFIDAEAQRTEYAAIRRVLVAWRARKRTAAETLQSLETLDERRRLIESRAPGELPPLPEPFIRSTPPKG